MKIILIVATALLGSVCGSPSTPAGARPGGIEWQHIGSWSGQGTTQIASFNIESEEWRVLWETRSEASAGLGRFRLGVHSSDSGREIAVAADHRGVGHDTSYVRDVPRRYYLEVNSDNLDWLITVEQAVLAR